MDLLFEVSGLFIGIVGWIGTSLLIIRLDRMTHIQKRAMVVLAWLVWMLPAFHSVVRHGVLTADVALQYCCGFTVLIALSMVASAMPWRTRP